MNKTTFTKRHYDSILITQEYRWGNQWMEASCEFSRKDFTISKFNYRLMSYETDSLANWQGRKNACNYFGEEVITEAENKLGKQIRQLRGIIAKGKKHPAYASMKPIAREVIKAYQDDFKFHDVLNLGLNNPDNFIWVVRSCGSWLISQKESLPILEYNVSHQDEVNRFFVFAHGFLLETNSTEALKIARAMFD
jgi:hypothetical protein